MKYLCENKTTICCSWSAYFYKEGGSEHAYLTVCREERRARGVRPLVCHKYTNLATNTYMSHNSQNAKTTVPDKNITLYIHL